MPLFEPIFEALNRSGARYVVVGGVAVVLHGYLRVTGDLDLIVDLSPAGARKAIETLLGIGMRCPLPVDPLEFADPGIREEWMRQKGMCVFPMVDPANPMRQVDLLVDSPIDFEGLWSRAVTIEVGSTPAKVVSIPDLIELKRAAGRMQDAADIEVLEGILRRKKRDV